MVPKNWDCSMVVIWILHWNVHIKRGEFNTRPKNSIEGLRCNCGIRCVISPTLIQDSFKKSFYGISGECSSQPKLEALFEKISYTCCCRMLICMFLLTHWRFHQKGTHLVKLYSCILVYILVTQYQCSRDDHHQENGIRLSPPASTLCSQLW